MKKRTTTTRIPTTAKSGAAGVWIRTVLPSETRRLIDEATAHDGAGYWRRTLLEVGFLYALIALVEWFWFDGSIGSFGVHPHPYWLVILPMAAARGLPAGLFAATVGALLYGVGVFGSPGAAGMDSLLDLLTMRDPVLFFAVAYIVGEFRDGLGLRFRRLGDGWLRIEHAIEALINERDVLAAANRDLEQRLVEHSGQFGNLIRTATRLEAADRQLVYEVALELCEEHTGSRASVFEVEPDGSVRLAAQRGLSQAEAEHLAAGVRDSALVERAIRRAIPVDGLRGEMPGEGPLAVVPLCDGNGFVRAVLCLDEVPTSRLNASTTRTFFGIGEWITASLVRLERGSEVPARSEVLDFAREHVHTLGSALELGQRLAVERERSVRYDAPFCLIGVRAVEPQRLRDVRDAERRILATFGEGLRATDRLYRFAQPGTWVVVLTGLNAEACEVPLRRLRERAAEERLSNQLGTLEIFAIGDTGDGRKASALWQELAERFQPGTSAAAEDAQELRAAIGDRHACRQRFELESRLAQRMGTDLTLIELWPEVPRALPDDLYGALLEPRLAMLVRRLDGLFRVDANHLWAILPGTRIEDARIVARRLQTALENALDDEARQALGQVCVECRTIDGLRANPFAHDAPARAGEPTLGDDRLAVA